MPNLVCPPFNQHFPALIDRLCGSLLGLLLTFRWEFLCGPYICAGSRHGRYNLCPDVKFAATPPVHGSLARYIVHPAEFCYRIPDRMSFDVAALLEPLSVGIHATRRADVSLGHTVLVAGCGTVGLVSIVAARKAGAQRIVATDIDQGRLDVARSLGADEVLLVLPGSNPQELGRTIEADACIECSGVGPIFFCVALLFPSVISLGSNFLGVLVFWYFELVSNL